MAGHDGAFHEGLDRDEHATGPSDRRFGYTFAIVGLVIGAVSLWRHGHYANEWLAGGVLFALVATVWPRALSPVNKAWMKLAVALSSITTPIVMGLLFFGFISPMAAAIRVRGKDPLRLKRDSTARSYWIERDPPGPAPDSLKHQF
jgi:hypothetical protein